MIEQEIRNLIIKSNSTDDLMVVNKKIRDAMLISDIDYFSLYYEYKSKLNIFTEKELELEKLKYKPRPPDIIKVKRYFNNTTGLFELK